MNKFRQLFRHDLLQDTVVRIWIAILVSFVIAGVVIWSYLPPPLPDVVRLGTGPANGRYARFGEALRRRVAEHGVELETINTAGSKENIRLLLGGDIDVALVQSGNLSDAQAGQLLSVASVFYEPVLVVVRVDWDGDYIEGGRIAIGPEGSGENALATELLADQGVGDGIPPGTRLVEVGEQQAIDALLAGEVDSGVFVTSLEVPWVSTLFTDPRLRVIGWDDAEAFTRHYRYLERIVIPAGLIDLRYRVPSSDMQAIATTASLVIRPDVHKALIPLLIESAREQLYQGSLLAEPEEFPSAHGVEAPLAEEALRYFERGPSFFYRWLPYHYASIATRLTIILIPLLTLMYPVLSLAGPTYRWAIERRIYRWYRVLGRIERRMDASSGAADLSKIESDLDRIQDQIRHMYVPSRYASNLFTLRMHHKLLEDRLRSLQNRAASQVNTEPDQPGSKE